MAEGPVLPSAGCGNRSRPVRLKNRPAPWRSASLVSATARACLPCRNLSLRPPSS